MDNRPESSSRYLNDLDRLAVLARTGLLDSEAEPSYDRLARLAAKFLGAPVALVSLVDDHRQFFKSCIGLPEPWASQRGTPLSHSFCQYVVSSKEPLVIDDALDNPLVEENPAIAEIDIVAYLGIPLTIDGQVIGSFCAIDSKPRAWTADDVEILRDLAESVVTEIRLRIERQEIEHQRNLAESARQRIEVTLSSIGDAVIATDAEGVITFMNPVAETLSGFMAEEAVGGPLEAVLQIFDRETREASENPVFKAIAEGKRASLAKGTVLVAKDGTERSIEDSAAPIRTADAKIEGAVLVFRDTTDRERANQAIREGEDRYRTLYNSIDEGFFAAKLIHDDQGTVIDYRFLAVNPAFGKQTGWSDVVGKRVREFAPDLESFWFETFDAIAQTGEPMRFEHSVEALESRFFDVYGFRDGDREEQTVAILFNDITPRKQAEKERERLVNQLRDADARKDEFLAMLAHELRNPLGAISSGVQLVQTTKKPELLEQLGEMIQRQVVHLTRLIDDLLDVSRITQGKIALRKTTVDLVAVMSRAVELVQRIITEKRHELHVVFPDRPVHFVADPTRAEQVLGNLLTNAAKYSEPGGRIRFSAEVVGHEIVFRVRDTGVGISAEMLPKVFGLFTQVDATIDRSQGGLGIGLTLVKNLVEMHGGSVSAASEGRGKGSEFTVHLPVGQPAVEAPKPVAPASPSRTGKGRILVVDDNVDTAKLTARMLKHAGFEVQTAHDGNEALDVAHRFQPAIVLLDIGLPGMNGYEVANALRDDEACKSAVLIAVSGYGEEKSRERSKGAGFDHHLTKPLDFNELMSMIGT